MWMRIGYYFVNLDILIAHFIILLKPFFIITVDTEGDNLWARPRSITCHNASYIPRFQSLCESFGFKPTYLVNYEMASDKTFVKIGREFLKRKAAEIGMHLHAWNTPPNYQISEDDFSKMHCLIEYPKDVIYEKVKHMTNLLEDSFGEKMICHRAGRWQFNEIYAQALIDFGYKADCSVVPGWDWRFNNPGLEIAGDFSRFRSEAYFIDRRNIWKKGNTDFLEVPMTIIHKHKEKLFRRKIRLISNRELYVKATNLIFPPDHFPQRDLFWMRPYMNLFERMWHCVEVALFERRYFVQFMVHSSELMPGANPNFKTHEDVEVLYQQLEKLFLYMSDKFQGGSISDFYNFYYKKIRE